jgi:hypothetical protein
MSAIRRELPSGSCNATTSGSAARIAATTWCRLSCTPLRQMLKTMTLSLTGSAAAEDSVTMVARMTAQRIRSKRMSPPCRDTFDRRDQHGTRRHGRSSEL